ncbi:MAG: YicC family protein [Alicyclobacillaceae bacterium]|nr:YicC family protein [Alicyclobacillaceae bacterium]
MPCHSMTGFGQALCVGQRMRVKVEIRTVNHRFLEFSVRLPRELLALEDDVRSLVASRVARGRTDVFVAAEPVQPSPKRLSVDWSLFEALVEAERAANARCGLTQQPVSVVSWLLFPDVVTVEAAELAIDEVRADVLRAVEEASSQLAAMRAREGARLAADMAAKLADLRRIVAEMERVAPDVEKLHRDRLERRMAEWAGVVDEQRLLNEIAVLMDRTAIDEELVRLASHLSEMELALAGGSPVGRRLDFIVQEMHREVNTIGSKAGDLRVARLVVDARVIVEQLREQAQNIE